MRISLLTLLLFCLLLVLPQRVAAQQEASLLGQLQANTEASAALSVAPGASPRGGDGAATLGATAPENLVTLPPLARGPSQFGESVAAGDFDGDGYTDLAVGAPAANEVYIYYGGPNVPAMTQTARAGEAAGSSFGYSVAAGNLNADPYMDVVVGAPAYPGGGKVYVFYGTSSGISASAGWTKTSDQAGAEFGFSVATGDFTGDNIADVLVGAPGYDKEATNDGLATMFQGTAGGVLNTAIWSIWGGAQNGVGVGYAVASASDVTGDQIDDILLGVPFIDLGQKDEGAVFFFKGGAPAPSTTLVWSKQSDQADANFGFSVAGGYFDADGFADVLVGAPFFDYGAQDNGLASLYRGGAGGPAGNPIWSVTGDANGVGVGFTVGSAGFLDGGSREDVAIGVPAQGKVYVYRGGSLDQEPFVTLAGEDASSFGLSLTAAGDVNDDGQIDLLIGDPGANAVYLYTGPEAPPPPDTYTLTVSGRVLDEAGMPVNGVNLYLGGPVPMETESGSDPALPPGGYRFVVEDVGAIADPFFFVTPDGEEYGFSPIQHTLDLTGVTFTDDYHAENLDFTATPRPAAPFPYEPVDGSLTSLVPTLRWTEIEGASGYYLVVSRSETFAYEETAWEGERTEPFHTFSAGVLEPETTYYWRVIAFFDDGMHTQWSDPIRFETGAVGNPRLVVTKDYWLSADGTRGTARPGDEVSYVIKVENKGDAPAYHVVLKDLLEDEHLVLAGGAMTGSDRPGEVVSGELPTDTHVEVHFIDPIVPGDFNSAIFTAAVTDAVPAGVTQVANQAVVTADADGDGELDLEVRSDDPEIEGAQDPTVVPVNPSPRVAELVVEKTYFTDQDVVPVRPGDFIGYTIRVRNTGEAPAYRVQVVDEVDANVDLNHNAIFVDGDDSPENVVRGYGEGDTVVEAHFPEPILPGASADVSFTVNVKDEVPVDLTGITNQAMVVAATQPEGAFDLLALSDDPDVDGAQDPTVVPATPHGFAQVQVIHNIPFLPFPVDLTASIDEDGDGTYETEVVHVEDLPFRAHTGSVAGAVAESGFLTVPAGETLRIVASVAGQTLTVTYPGREGEAPLATGGRYILHITAASMADVRATLLPVPTTTASKVRQAVAVVFWHGVPDAPAVDFIDDETEEVLAEDVAFGASSGLLSLETARYTVNVVAHEDGTLLASFLVDLTEAEGDLVQVLASGFLEPGDFGGGPAFSLVGLDADGEGTPAPVVTDTEEPGAVPDRFVLVGNYPNPFNPSTTLTFDLHRAAEVDVAVFDLQGREVLRVAPQAFAAGTGQRIVVDAARLPSGVYLYRLRAVTASETHHASGRMTLVK